MADGSPPDSRFHEVSDLYRQWGGFVARSLRRFGVPDAELDDAVQETFLVVYRRLDDFEGRCSSQTWLYAIAFRVASSLRRSHRRETARRETAGRDVHGAGVVDPEKVVGEREAWDILQGLLDELDEAKRAVFVLTEVEGLRVPEVARILGLKPNTVHSRLRLARARFDAALRRHHAREQGRWTRAQLVRGAADTPPSWSAERSRAVWSALALKLPSAGGVAGWLSASGALARLGLGAKSTWAFVGVGACAAGLGLGVLVRLNAGAPAPSPSPSSASMSPPVSSASPPSKVSAVDPSSASIGGGDAPSELAEEARLLERARRALQRRDAQAALAAIEAHAAAYPQGLLAHERESSRLHALCLAGRRDDAIAWTKKLGAAQEPVWREVLDARCPAP